MDICPPVGKLDRETTPEVQRMPMHALLSASDPVSQLAIVLSVAVAMIIGMSAMTIAVATKYYKRCPSNCILVVFG